MALAFDTDVRAGSAWLAREGSDQQNALITGLLSRFNHDLRTPLNTIIGWAHLLQQGAVDNTRSKHVADVLGRNAREQTVLLEEFVDDSRAVLGILKLDSTMLRLPDVVAHAVERATPTLTLLGVTVEPRLEAADAVTVGDERRLQRLVYRLLIAVARRARETSAVELVLQQDTEGHFLTFSAEAGASDWAEATLLDLRVCSFMAAMHEADLRLDSSAGRASIRLGLQALG
jgi:signal transduction histidine kinase